ncbi:MAG: IMP dehydrogenase [Patescibacteria group bacterium]
MNSKDLFFKKIESIGLALSFDDVRLRSSYSKIMPINVDLKTKFSRNVSLKIPLVSAAMDTITEHKMAINMALLGGLGIIHRNNSSKQQADEVAKVKFYLNGLIDKPICVFENDVIQNVLNHKKEKGYVFHSFPVLNSLGHLVGIVTKNDFDFCNNRAAKRIKDIMSKQIIVAPQNTNLNKAYDIMIKNKKKVLPLVDKNKFLRGMYVFSDVIRIKFGGSLSYNTDKNGRLRVGAAIGAGNDVWERLDLLNKENVDVVVIDTAHGDSKNVINVLKKIKKKYSSFDVVVGNISEGESAKNLAMAGADGIKVGQGPGSICTTRIIAGIGCPQVTAIYNCSKAIVKAKIPVCADGGIRNSGDITIALGAGADSVMLGRLLAGTKETPGDVIFYKGMQVKNYRGMGSLGAMESSAASRERYNQIFLEKNKLVPEGVEGVVTYQGEAANIIYQYLGGLRSGMGYVGAANIAELHKKANFFRISSSGLVESHPHDIFITKDAPNYRK